MFYSIDPSSHCLMLLLADQTCNVGRKKKSRGKNLFMCFCNSNFVIVIDLYFLCSTFAVSQPSFETLRNILKHVIVETLLSVVTTVVVPLLLSYFALVKGVFSPVPPYCGYSKPSHSFDISFLSHIVRNAKKNKDLPWLVKKKKKKNLF